MISATVASKRFGLPRATDVQADLTANDRLHAHSRLSRSPWCTTASAEEATLALAVRLASVRHKVAGSGWIDRLVCIGADVGIHRISTWLRVFTKTEHICSHWPPFRVCGTPSKRSASRRLCCRPSFATEHRWRLSRRSREHEATIPDGADGAHAIGLGLGKTTRLSALPTKLRQVNVLSSLKYLVDQRGERSQCLLVLLQQMLRLCLV